MTEKQTWQERREAAEAAGAKTAHGSSGKGFIKWTELGQYVEGRVIDVWTMTTPNGPKPVATIEVGKITTPVYGPKDRSGDKPLVPIGLDDLVYLDLNLTDLQTKIGPTEVGHYIALAWTDNKPTKHANPMKMFDVVVYPLKQDQGVT